MTENHPITPPPGVVEKWIAQAVDRPASTKYMNHFATQAAQWGADMELEACCEWLDGWCHDEFPGGIENLRAARRPKPPSLKKQALKVLESAPGPDYPSVMTILDADQHALIRRALEALPND
jgi:hypothetical protein